MDTAAVARRLVVGLDGVRPTVAEQGWLQHYQPEGVILFARNVTGPGQLRSLCLQLRQLLPPGAEIMADHEGGPISVLAAALGRPPALFGLGVLSDPDLTRRVHRDSARLMHAAGLQRVLAPCADVLANPDNPVIGARSFGVDPRAVAGQVAAAVTGLREGGILACLKHWPGHGGTTADSHDEPAVGDAGIFPQPFQAGIRAGADAIMLSHLLVTSEPSRRRMPATLAPHQIAKARTLMAGRALTLFADDLTMAALRPAMAELGITLLSDPEPGLLDPGRLPHTWFAAAASAGCDRLLCRGIPWLAFPWPVPATIPGASPATITGAAPENSSETVSEVVPHPGSYVEARSRLADRQRPWTPPEGADSLLWIDATRQDRWGEAVALEPLLVQHFRTVVRLSEAEAGWSGDSFGALLLTSHRPWRQERSVGPWCSLLARQGLALAMGHPSLAGALGELLPQEWRLVELFDTDPADLRPVLDALFARRNRHRSQPRAD
jgi:hypothetical protein